MRRPLARPVRGLPLRAIAPNAVTALALCSGLTGIRFALTEQWQLAVTMILIAGLLDGIDGRVARLLHGESRFGAELDSLSDAISFGVSPAMILYLWSLHQVVRLGWIVALMMAVFCALRLARFNAAIDTTEQPHKSAGFLTGVPAPVGAGLAMLPLYIWFWSSDEGLDWLSAAVRSPWLTLPWVALIASLMVSSLATFSWTSLKLRSHVRFEAIVLIVVLVAALVSAPWETLTAISIGYVATVPFSIRSYARITRLRASPAGVAPSPLAPERADSAP